MTDMTWEAFRLTSKSPAEVLHILGPHGVDDLIRKAMDAVWREYPESTRTYDAVNQRILEVYERNRRYWATIRKPSPQAFFANLPPYTADGHIRQALVLTWMMLPRAGGRDFAEVRRIVERIFRRNLEAWDEDHTTFTSPKPRGRAGKRKPPVKKPLSKKRPSGKSRRSMKQKPSSPRRRKGA